MEVFAESEIVIPDGPHAGMRYSCDRQPYSRLWFRAIDASEGRKQGAESPLSMAGGDGVHAWRNFIAVGPTQSGKTLTCLIIPVMYHLFEEGETVICVVPDLKMVDDKWRQDFLPAIKASRYAALLPVRGEGSRGGVVTNAVTFQNGVTLKFMTAGGGDTARAAFTARVVAITEMNRFGNRKEGSSEADMFRQVKGRMRAYGDRARLYGECTVTTEQGLVWAEYTGGTESRIATPCPHCEEYVTLDRAQLVGWESAASAVEAERLSQWVCPSCGVLLSEQDRRRMVRRGVLLHKGQSVAAPQAIAGKTPPAPPQAGGKKQGASGSATGDSPLSIKGKGSGVRIVGAPKDTFTLGFRWSAFDNLFLSTGYIGSGEWSARNLATDAESAEREQLQFVWARPIADTADRSVTLRSDELCHRQGRFARGVIPPGCGLVAFLDLGKYRCHWVVLAGSRTPPTSPQAGGNSMRYWLVDCGVIRTDVGPLSERDGLMVAMREFHEICDGGWPSASGSDDDRWSPALRFVDSGKWTAEVYEFMMAMAAEGHEGYFPSKGHGASQDQGRVYREQKAITERVMVIGDRYHLARQEVSVEDGSSMEIALVHIDVDAWKTRVHAALSVDGNAPGSLMLWHGDWREHMPVARALLSEVAIEDFKPGDGVVVTWKKVHRENHYLDGFAGCAAALDYLGYLEGEGEQLAMDNGQWTTEDALGAKGEEVPAGRVLGDVQFGGALRRS